MLFAGYFFIYLLLWAEFKTELGKLAKGVILSDVLTVFAHVLPPVPLQLSVSGRSGGENSVQVNVSIYAVWVHLECFHPSHPWTMGEERAKSSLLCPCGTNDQSQNSGSWCKSPEGTRRQENSPWGVCPSTKDWGVVLPGAGEDRPGPECQI